MPGGTRSARPALIRSEPEPAHLWFSRGQKYFTSRLLSAVPPRMLLCMRPLLIYLASLGALSGQLAAEVRVDRGCDEGTQYELEGQSGRHYDKQRA